MVGSICEAASNHMVQLWSTRRLSCDIPLVTPKALVVDWNSVLSVVSSKQVEGHPRMPIVPSIVYSYVRSTQGTWDIRPTSGHTGGFLNLRQVCLSCLLTWLLNDSECTSWPLVASTISTFTANLCHAAGAMQGTKPGPPSSEPRILPLWDRLCNWKDTNVLRYIVIKEGTAIIVLWHWIM